MKYFVYLYLAGLLISCSSANISENVSSPESEEETRADYSYLALGDSYTIGESVCDACRFPEQLKEGLKQQLNATELDLEIIARTGWTTTQLQAAIDQEDPRSDYDLVTLLIGVNNQFQGLPFSRYEAELETLLQKAIELASGNADNVIVLSIPDYAFTPFGQSTSNSQQISRELDAYNTFAQSLTAEYVLRFLNITDITREGLEDPGLVASDGLHPSKEAYERFVERLLPIAFEKIKD